MMDADPRELAEIRRRIDAVDRQLLEAFNQRARLARRVAEVKRDAGDGDDIYRPEREAEVLRALREANQGPFDDDTVAGLFQEVMAACRTLQRRIVVAFPGPPGTFTEAAARKQFGNGVETRAIDTIDGVFREVEAETADFGVVPVENSTEGVVSHTLDSLVRSRLAICGEIELRIHHCVVGQAEELSAVGRVYAHQQSLAQCRKWLDRELVNAERYGVESTAEAARRAAAEPGTVALAGVLAARTYGLEVLASNVEDEPGGRTRFLVIGARHARPSGFDKTTVLLAARDRPGVLYDLLNAFARRAINLTRIESRQARDALWDYAWFIDLEGHAEDPPIVAALEELGGEAVVCKVLGSYPRGVH